VVEGLGILGYCAVYCFADTCGCSKQYSWPSRDVVFSLYAFGDLEGYGKEMGSVCYVSFSLHVIKGNGDGGRADTVVFDLDGEPGRKERKSGSERVCDDVFGGIFSASDGSFGGNGNRE